MRIALPPLIAPGTFATYDRTAPIIMLDGLTMGTSWHIVLARPRTVDLDALQAAIVARLAGLVAEMSHWDPVSLLSKFNRAPPGTWMTLPPDFAHVVAAALRIAAATDGAFDPTIGRLVDAWGFGPPGPAPSPDENAIDVARDASGWQRLTFDAAARRLRQPGGLALDLSGIAKGHAVDALAQLLRAAGVHHALVEIGGELAGMGIRPDGDPWWVDLEPPPDADVVPLRIALHDLAVATSGAYRRGNHSLDPRTGRPAVAGVVSVSVLHATAMEADAWATALTVLGPAAGITLAEQTRIAARIISMTDGGPSEHLTPALRAMVTD